MNLIQKLETQNLYTNLKNQLKFKSLKILYIMSRISFELNYLSNLNKHNLVTIQSQFIQLNERKFGHGFNDTINPICPCGTEVETN